MLEEVTPTNQNETDDDPNLVATFFSALELPELWATLFVNSKLLEKLFDTLAENNAISSEQCQAILSETKASLAKMIQSLSEEIASGERRKNYSADDLDRMTKRVESSLRRFEKYLPNQTTD